jgi:hypothetical protein
MLATRFLVSVILCMFRANEVSLDFSATCTGADPCHASKNFRYCRHCAKEGGKCGICE